MLNSWSATQLTFHSPEPMQHTFCPDIPHPFLSIRPTPQRIKTTLTHMNETSNQHLKTSISPVPTTVRNKLKRAKTT